MFLIELTGWLLVEMDVCIVTPGHLATSPRVVKEAAALCDAGYSVAVVAADYFSPVRPFDAVIVKAAAWRCFAVRLRWRLIRAFFRRLHRRIAAIHVNSSRPVPWLLAADAHHYLWRQLARVAFKQRARLYIGHGIAGLAAAAWAAGKTGALLGFDAEDYHPGETEAVVNDKIAQSCVRSVERSLMPRCRHLTAAAPLIAQAYAHDYGVRAMTLLNVFSLKEAPAQPAFAPRNDNNIKAYWFSQTIGPGRGLEAFILAASYLPDFLRVDLHLRGTVSETYRAQLENKALAAPSLSLHFHSTAEAGQMVLLAADYDLGLCLEEDAVPNRELCLTNKIFTYLLAGVPVLLSATKAHKALAPDLGIAALIVDLNNPQEAAASLVEYYAQPDMYKAAQLEAWRLGRERYNWELEQIILQDMVQSLLKGSNHKNSV